MRKIKQTDRPFLITYVRGAQRIRDSAATLQGAIARVCARLAKAHNKRETAEVWFRNELVHVATPSPSGES